MSILEVLLQLFLTLLLGILVITPIIFIFSWVHKKIIIKKIPEHFKTNYKEVNNKDGIFKEKERFNTTRKDDKRGNETFGERELAEQIKRRIADETFRGTDAISKSDKLQQLSGGSFTGDNKTIKIHRPINI